MSLFGLLRRSASWRSDGTRYAGWHTLGPYQRYLSLDSGFGHHSSVSHSYRSILVVPGDVAVAGKGAGGRRGQRVRVVRRFHFTSQLKRMATIVALDHISSTTFFATAKAIFLALLSNVIILI